MIRTLRRWWRRNVTHRPIALPGRYPWNRPKPLPRGTVLIDGPHPICADGRGGVTVLSTGGPHAAGPPPPGFTAQEWRAVEVFLDRHTDAEGNCDIDAMNAEVARRAKRRNPR